MRTTKTVSQGESRYGTAEPQIEIRLPKGTRTPHFTSMVQVSADAEESE